MACVPLFRSPPQTPFDAVEPVPLTLTTLPAVFILEGLITVVVGVGCFWFLPGLPSKTKWLTEEERRFAIWRSAVDAMGDRVRLLPSPSSPAPPFC